MTDNEFCDAIWGELSCVRPKLFHEGLPHWDSVAEFEWDD